MGHKSCKYSFLWVLWNLEAFIKRKHPKWHTTSNPRRFDVDITSIRWRPSFDEFSRHFHILFQCNLADRKIHLVSTYFFQRNFAGRKIHVVSTYFFRCNFDGRKIQVVSMHLFQCNFSGWNVHVVSAYFLRGNFDGQKLTSLLVTWKLMKTFGEVFLCL